MSIYTDWFPVAVNPVHVGWYQCRCCFNMMWWTGQRWRADPYFGGQDVFVRCGWRGLKEKADE